MLTRRSVDQRGRSLRSAQSQSPTAGWSRRRLVRDATRTRQSLRARTERRTDALNEIFEPRALAQLCPVERAETSPTTDGPEEEAVLTEDDERRDEHHHVATHADARRASMTSKFVAARAKRLRTASAMAASNAQSVLRQQRRDANERDVRPHSASTVHDDRLLGVAFLSHGANQGGEGRASADFLMSQLLLPTGSATGEQHCDQC